MHFSFITVFKTVLECTALTKTYCVQLTELEFSGLGLPTSIDLVVTGTLANGQVMLLSVVCRFVPSVRSHTLRHRSCITYIVFHYATVNPRIAI
jgi:hypothetical protein